MEKSTKKKNVLKKVTKIGVLIALSIIFSVIIVVTYQIIVADKYFPQTSIGDTNLSFLTKGQAIAKFQEKFDARTKQQLSFVLDKQTFTLDIATVSATLDYSIFDSGFNFGRDKNFFDSLREQLQALFLTYRLIPKINMNLDRQIQAIQAQVDKPFQNAQLVYDELPQNEGSPSARIQVIKGIDGFGLNKEALILEINEFILFGKYQTQLPIKSIPPTITTEHIRKAKQTLEKISTSPIILSFENSNWTIDTKQLLTLLDLSVGANLLLDKDKTYLYLTKIALEINSDVTEGQFEINPNTKRVSAFKPSRQGRKLDLDKTYQMLTESLSGDGSNIIHLPVDIVKPKIETSDVNSLGIKELIGRGVSNFIGSIPNRDYNINLTASKINGVLVPPGEIFSFNQTVGDISAATGFKQAYVIKNGRTVLDDGGGVCQDSTTVFRAVLNAGLPVIKRTAHAYRVDYYEQGFPPGLDATIFYPSVDFQFKNDTQHHILIQAYTTGNTLYVDLYGTSDKRTVSMTKPIIENQTPPPPDLRQDDPTLPRGVVKKVDWSAWGANVSFKRTVTRNGETLLDETWRSNYKAWQAVYLVGTQ